MRVLLSAFAISPKRGTEPGNSWRLASGLAERGIEVELLTTTQFADDWPEPEARPPNLQITTVDDSVPRLLRHGQIGVYARYVAWQHRSLAEARRIHAAHRVDIVHHYSWGSLVWASPLWKLGIPFVFGPVGGGSVGTTPLSGALSSSARRAERLRTTIIWLLPLNPRMRRSLRSAFIIAANSDTSSLISRIGAKSRVLMLPDAAAPEFMSLETAGIESREAGRVVWVGRLLPRKGIAIALSVMKHLPPEVTLTIIGDGPEFERAAALIRELKLEKRVDLRGRMPWTDIVDELDKSMVLLFTSVRDTFGAQLLEAGARGTPIVAIRQQGIADYVPNEAGVLVQIGSPDVVAARLAAGIEDLMGDPGRWRKASAAARAFAEDHSLDRQLDQVISVYETLVAKSPAR
jgi:glycosyltransferase involved in cell wall biosynthesis